MIEVEKRKRAQVEKRGYDRRAEVEVQRSKDRG